MRAHHGDARVPIVAIGASAGGLEAIEQFFGAMPAGSGLAFVLLTHLDPRHVSVLPELVQRVTSMTVTSAADGLEVQPDHVYVLPPSAEMGVDQGALRISPRSAKSAHRPVDGFFRALALDHGKQAICIVLSGTGDDGTAALKASAGAVGLVLAQDPQSAKFAEMPENAISTGVVDDVLSPELMPARVLRYLANSTTSPDEPTPPDDQDVVEILPHVQQLLRAFSGHDFSQYKQSTLCRRILRRIAALRLGSAQEYVGVLQESEREARTLFGELLIGVTEFFRDAEAFDHLATEILPRLLDDKDEGAPIRVWVAGCSTGEEAYSVAILLSEALEKVSASHEVQIFATDLDEEAIRAARTGEYEEAVMGTVSDTRRKRYFEVQESGRYRIRKAVRDMVVFAAQNMLRDPPFTKLDLLCCRNVLIYLDAEAQQRLLALFHYSLQPGGTLFLGSSESIGHATDHFSPMSKRWKTFRRLGGRAESGGLGLLPRTPPAPRTSAPARPLIPRAAELSALGLVETMLKESGAPPAVLIDESQEVLYIHGRTGRYLEPAEGLASQVLLDMARPELRADLAQALQQARSASEDVVRSGVVLPRREVHETTVEIKVKPIFEPSALQGLLLVTFESTGAGSTAAHSRVERKSRRELEAELRSTRASLRTTIDELQISNEELKSTNEELQSTNEELQSTNEELETSKEELQSLNEEAASVNAELQGRIDELTRTNDDMKNLLDSTNVATLFLDTDLRIGRFTPQATRILPLSRGDAGRPVSHLAPHLIDVDVSARALEVLEDLTPQEQEVRSVDGRHYTMRIRPYRTQTNVIQGVVLTFDDITARRTIEDALRGSEQLHRSFTESFPGTACLMAAGDNAKPLQLLGRDIRELTGYGAEAFFRGSVRLEQLVLAEDAHDRLDRLARWTKAIEGTIGSPVPLDQVYRIRHRNGSLRTVREIDTACAAAQQRGYWCILLDITPPREGPLGAPTVRDSTEQTP